MKPIIFIRADANEKIGTGHIMRCMSIARECVNQGIDVVFVTADHKADKLITEFEHVCLDTDWMDMEKEIGKLIALIDDHKPSMVLVDSYYVTEKYFDILKSRVRTAYVDDLNKKTWHVDFLINYNIFAGELDYSSYEQKNTKLLLSPIYAPLREEFKKLPKYEAKESVNDIFVSAGGADPEGVTEKIIKNICPDMERINFHFVVGALNPRIDAIKKLEKGNIILHINERNMSQLMKKCDIAISAAGSTLYELCACGIPTITYTLADNQLLAAEKFLKDGIMINLGDFRNNGQIVKKLKEDIIELINNVDKRRALSINMQTLVDGNGAKRIVENLLSL